MNHSTPSLPVHHQLPEFMSIESVMPSSPLILCRPLLLPPIPPSIRVFSNESTLRMRWAKYCSFSFSIIPSKCFPLYIYVNQLYLCQTKSICFLIDKSHTLLCVFYKLIPTSTDLWNCLTQHILGLFISGCFDPIKYWRLQENLFNIQIKLEIRSETFCSFIKKKTMMKRNSYYLTDDFILGAETFEKFHGILVERMRDKMANDILILSLKIFLNL